MEAVSNAKLAEAGRREHLDEAGEERWVKNRSSRTVVRKSVPWAVGLSLSQSVRPSNAGKQSLELKAGFHGFIGFIGDGKSFAVGGFVDGVAPMLDSRVFGHRNDSSALSCVGFTLNGSFNFLFL